MSDAPISQDFFVSTARNMEALLATELHNLGISSAKEGRGGTTFSGSLEDAYKVCLWSRVANRVLLPLAKFPAADEHQLYAGIQQIDWSQHIDSSGTLAVDASLSNSKITHSQYAALKVKDAIVDQFREACGERPSIDTDEPNIRINLYLFRDEATVSLDLSGNSLHKRGYRAQGVAAPLKETLAAAILLRANWQELSANGATLVDLMCGSGTLPIEAAMIAADQAPGFNRTYWGFEGWKQHDADSWNALEKDANERRLAGIAKLGILRGYDRDPSAIKIAKHNARLAGFADHLEFECRDISEAAPANADDTGLVVINPPYGERLGELEELGLLYAQIGECMRDRFNGWNGALFTGSAELGKTMGLRAAKMHALYNGALECRLLHFTINDEAHVKQRRFPSPIIEANWEEGARSVANRLRKNLKHLGRWAKRDSVKAWRVYDADIPDYAVAVDIYDCEDQRHVVVQEYEAPRTVDAHKAKFRLREALGAIMSVLQVKESQIHFKVRKQQKGKAQYEKLNEDKRFFNVQEGACLLDVNFEDYLDTGLFLDHRLTRLKIAEMAKGQSFLNLFAYTGAATVHAAQGGASETTTVDMSKTYLGWARKNMALNGLGGRQHDYIHANVLEWLDQAGSGSKRYDVIFLDPPSFSTSKRMEGTFDVQRDHVELLRKTVRLLSDKGVLIFSNNLRKFRMETDSMPELVIEDISRATIPPDFERNPKIHNCHLIRRK